MENVGLICFCTFLDAEKYDIMLRISGKQD